MTPPQGRNWGSGYYDAPRARLAVELMARCPRAGGVVVAVMEANCSARPPEWTANLLRVCLHTSELAADARLLGVLDLLAPQWEGSLEDLLMVARDGILA